MGKKMMLRIIDLGEGRWKFDLTTGMSDDEIRKLISRMKRIESKLNDRLETETVKVSETIEFLKDKRR
jgi:hypothetical protein